MDKERIIFHIDVNNAFLSWTAVKFLEEGSKLDIRKIASVIAGDESKRHGIVLAKSPVAKKYGIKTAETLFSARKKCSYLKVYPAFHDYYKKKSNELFSYLSKFSPDIEIFSIDECFMDMTNTNYLYKDFLSLAYKIKDEIFLNYGFTVNIGIANNKLCAKMASDFEKPNKVHTLYDNQIKDKMWPLPIEELFMVGKQTSKKLRELNINTIGELANTNLDFLKRYFKKQAIIMWEYSNGIDSSEVVSKSDFNKCISISETLEKDINDINYLKKILLSQTQKVTLSLRKQKMYTSTIAITFKMSDFRTYTRQTTLETPSNSTAFIYEGVIDLFEKSWNGEKLRNIGVRLSNFTVSKIKQVGMFDSYNEENNENVDKIIDEINDKFGDNIIGLASLK